MFSDIRLHRMSFILLVNILLSEEDCQALQKEPFRNSYGLADWLLIFDFVVPIWALHRISWLSSIWRGISSTQPIFPHVTCKESWICRTSSWSLRMFESWNILLHLTHLFLSFFHSYRQVLQNKWLHVSNLIGSLGTLLHI